MGGEGRMGGEVKGEGRMGGEVRGERRGEGPEKWSHYTSIKRLSISGLFPVVLCSNANTTTERGVETSTRVFTKPYTDYRRVQEGGGHDQIWQCGKAVLHNLLHKGVKSLRDNLKQLLLLIQMAKTFFHV